MSSDGRLLRTCGFREIAAGIGILPQPQRRAPWVWGRVAGDLLDLTSLGAAFASRGADRTRVAVSTAAVLGVTALDLLCGQQLTNGETRERRIHARNTIIIDRGARGRLRILARLQ